MNHPYPTTILFGIKSYKEANRTPVALLSRPVGIKVKSGQDFSLDAFDTTDPNGDNFSFLWFNYPEAGS